MTNDWIMDVLSDLRQFADLNGLPQLKSSLERAAGVAAAEIGCAGEGGPTSGHVDGQDRAAHRGTGGRADA